MSKNAPANTVTVIAVQIPNGGLHDMVKHPGEAGYSGTLYGEEEDGSRWSMPFWLPDHVAEEWAEDNHVPF